MRSRKASGVFPTGWKVSAVGILVLSLAGTGWGQTTYNITPLGFENTEHTSDTGYRFSYVNYLNTAGQAAGTQNRYNGTANDLGRTAWCFNGAALFNIGLTDAEHTNTNGYRYSSVFGLNAAG